MPTMTICPKQLSMRSLMINYFNQYYDHEEMSDIDRELEKVVAKNSFLSKMLSFGEYVFWYGWYVDYEDVYPGCLDEKE